MHRDQKLLVMEYQRGREGGRGDPTMCAGPAKARLPESMYRQISDYPSRRGWFPRALVGFHGAKNNRGSFI